MTILSSPAAISGVHRRVAGASPQEVFLADLFDRLWDRYRARVKWVREYERVVHASGATFDNDHIAFRTIAGQSPPAGVFQLSRLFEALGYRAAGCYQFPDKHLNSVHYQHPNGRFPKLFISELQTWRLSPATREILRETLAAHRPAFPEDALAELSRLDTARLDTAAPGDRAALLDAAVRLIEERPWPVPRKADVVAVNAESQFGAWVMVHGYNVNHFTALINSHLAPSLADIDKTVAALRTAGIPMKTEIEGAPGTKLRQTATEAAVIDVAVRDGGVETTMPWTYAYFELAERGEVVDPETGRRGRFEGFLGPQATHLFEMTRVAGKPG